jgi:hypothetical protein
MKKEETNHESRKHERAKEGKKEEREDWKMEIRGSEAYQECEWAFES